MKGVKWKRWCKEEVLLQSALLLTLLGQDKRAPKQESANIQGPVKPRDQELNQLICLQP